MYNEVYGHDQYILQDFYITENIANTVFLKMLSIHHKRLSHTVYILFAVLG